MRANHEWRTAMLTTAAILAYILLPVSGFAVEPSANDQQLRAAGKGSLERIKDLLAKVEDVEARDRYYRMALIEAAKLGDVEVVKFLIDKGVDVNAKAEFDRTVLRSASWFRDQPEVVEYLKARGAK